MFIVFAQRVLSLVIIRRLFTLKPTLFNGSKHIKVKNIEISLFMFIEDNLNQCYYYDAHLSLQIESVNNIKKGVLFFWQHLPDKFHFS